MDFTTPPPSRYRPRVAVNTEPAAHHHQPAPAQEEEREEPAPKKRSKSAARPRSWKKIVFALIALGLVAWLAYGYITTKNELEQQKNSPSAGAANSSQALIDKIAKVTVLPTNEAPTIATINNVGTLRSQSAFNKFFFANAKDGDKLLVYQKNNLAIIYRTATNQVVSSGPYDYSKVIQNPKQ